MNLDTKELDVLLKLAKIKLADKEKYKELLETMEGVLLDLIKFALRMEKQAEVLCKNLKNGEGKEE